MKQRRKVLAPQVLELVDRADDVAYEGAEHGWDGKGSGTTSHCPASMQKEIAKQILKSAKQRISGPNQGWLLI